MIDLLIFSTPPPPPKKIKYLGFLNFTADIVSCVCVYVCVNIYPFSTVLYVELIVIYRETLFGGYTVGNVPQFVNCLPRMFTRSAAAKANSRWTCSSYILLTSSRLIPSNRTFQNLRLPPSANQACRSFIETKQCKITNENIRLIKRYLCHQYLHPEGLLLSFL